MNEDKSKAMMLEGEVRAQGWKRDSAQRAVLIERKVGREVFQR